MILTSKQIQAILDGAPEGAIEHCLYDYGDSTCPIYLNCENQFYDDDEKEWVDILLIDNYFHSRRRLSDLREILTLRQEVECLKAQQSEVAAQAVEGAAKDLSSLITAPPGKYSVTVLKLREIANQLREQGDE